MKRRTAGACGALAAACLVAASIAGCGPRPQPVFLFADSTAVRLEAGRKDSAPDPGLDPACEDLHAHARETGSLALLLEAAESHGCEVARSDLGFRLLLRGSRARGSALLNDVNDQVMNRFERAAHRARLAFLALGEDSLRAAVGLLERDYAGRFETLLIRSAADLRAGRLREAREGFEEGAILRPADPLPLVLLGESAFRDGFFGAASDAFRRALALDPRDPLAPIGLASILYSEGLLLEAEGLLARAPVPNPHGVEGTRPYFLHRAAEANLRFADGKFRIAREVLARARNEAYRLGDEESLIDLTVRRFHVFLEEEATDSAAAELSELRFREAVRRVRPEGPAAVPYYEGLLGAFRDDYGAVTAKRLELVTIPGADAFLADLIEGIFEARRGLGGEAAIPLRRALRRGESALARHYLGRASIARARWGDAIANLEWVVNRGESLLDSPLLLPLSYYYLGRAFEERGDRLDAELAYREFLHSWRDADAHRAEVSHARAYLRIKSPVGERENR
ncbi:MAG: hypothetical protein FJY73_09805 [Candidatus Eisenbacteria bacterium]|nr:hypothetical protein [Candidatus Eisenbacteria bacterium]